MIFKNKHLLRFFFLLSILLIFPFPLNLSSEFELPQNLVNAVYHQLIPWIGKNMLHLEKNITQFSGGSGDTTYDYVLLFFLVSLSLIGTLAWHLISKKDLDKKKLNYILEVMLRYSLGATIMYYGIVKVIPLQFPEPRFDRLIQTYGSSSPMGILWTFMGASKGYVIFSGIAETIGGLLLFHRKTKLMGTLILIPVLVNVVALNFFYDVPVKLLSSTLLLFAILLVIPDLKRILKVVLWNEPTEPKEFPDFFGGEQKDRTKPFLKWSIVLVIISVNIHNLVIGNSKYGFGAPKPILYGLYQVSDFTVNGISLPPMHTDSIGWRYITFQWEGSTQVHRNDMKRIGFESKVDTLKKEIFMRSFKDSTNTFTLKYARLDSTMSFSGVIKGDTVKILSRPKYKSDFLLMNRGFHWINETPYNR